MPSVGTDAAATSSGGRDGVAGVLGGVAERKGGAVVVIVVVVLEAAAGTAAWDFGRGAVALDGVAVVERFAKFTGRFFTLEDVHMHVFVGATDTT